MFGKEQNFTWPHKASEYSNFSYKNLTEKFSSYYFPGDRELTSIWVSLLLVLERFEIYI